MNELSCDKNGLVAEILVEIKRFIKENLQIKYLSPDNDKIFMDPRFDPEDVLLIINYLCKKYGISINNMSRFDGEFTLVSIAEYVAVNALCQE